MCREFKNYFKNFIIINERICCLRLKAKWFSCTLVNVHATTNESPEEIKEEFYNLIEQNINQIATSDIKIILGHFNTKIGKENIYIYIYKHIQTYTNIYKHIQTYTNIYKHIQTYTNIYKHIQTYTNPLLAMKIYIMKLTTTE